MGPVIPDDLLAAASKLKPKLSEGHDHISNKLLKETIPELSVPLAHIFNLSFNSGTVPHQMKIAKVIPIFKKGNAQLFTNYRPISILPAFSKLLEKIVYSRLYQFINTNDIFYEHQYGFRKKHSTIHPIIHYIKGIAESNDKRTKDITIATFLDLSKAFDTVSHDILLSKLRYYGIRGIANDWFSSYLGGRCQFTQINDTKSETKSISCGVPQGSTLGPLLFLLYVNDLSCATKLKVLGFADDTTVFTAGHNLREQIDFVNSELRSISLWLRENRLALNLSKTSCMIVSPPGKRIDPNVSVLIDNQVINRITKGSSECSIKFLGLILMSIYHGIVILTSLFAMNKAKHFFTHICPDNYILCLG